MLPVVFVTFRTSFVTTLLWKYKHCHVPFAFLMGGKKLTFILFPKRRFVYSHVSDGPPVWSSGRSFWSRIQRPGFDSRRYQIIWELMGLERGPFSLVSTIEELFETKSSGSGLENRGYGPRDRPRWPRDTLYPQKLALTSPTSGGRSVDIVRSRTKATELLLLLRIRYYYLPR
jgi:hypothetical protein